MDGNIGMATLKRSAISFRRQGSSGLAWEENWMPADVDGGAGGGPAPGPTLPPPPGTAGNNSHHRLHYAATSTAQSIHQKSSSSPSPQLWHSRSVGLIGAGYTRSRDHRVQSSHDHLDPVDTPQSAHKAETGHKSHSRVLRWFKRTFFKSKT